MKNILKSIGGMLLGIAIFVAIIVAIGLFFVYGTKIAFSIEPFINWLAGILFVIDLLVLLLAFSYKLRPFVGLVLFISSYVFGMSVWIYGLAVTLSLWGFGALVIGLFLGGIGVVPIGMLAAIFHSHWDIFFTLLITLVLTYGTRLVGATLVENDENELNEHPSEDFIEGETIEHKTRTWGDLG
ncbi:MAG TPA: hypothetical protein VFK11_04560 [Candidatus Saccharimonadales bacterium]|nr:hypothetical protein [Candidatus Saccharimonadales bacterium]